MIFSYFLIFFPNHVGNETEINELIEKGGHLNVRDSLGRMAMHLVSRHGEFHIFNVKSCMKICKV